MKVKDKKELDNRFLTKGIFGTYFYVTNWGGEEVDHYCLELRKHYSDDFNDFDNDDYICGELPLLNYLLELE